MGRYVHNHNRKNTKKTLKNKKNQLAQIYDGKHLWSRWVLSQWNSEGVTDEENGELTKKMTEHGQDENDSGETDNRIRDWFQRRGAAHEKEGSVISNKDDVSCRATSHGKNEYKNEHLHVSVTFLEQAAYVCISLWKASIYQRLLCTDPFLPFFV